MRGLYFLPIMIVVAVWGWSHFWQMRMQLSIPGIKIINSVELAHGAFTFMAVDGMSLAKFSQARLMPPIAPGVGARSVHRLGIWETLKGSFAPGTAIPWGARNRWNFSLPLWIIAIAALLPVGLYLKKRSQHKKWQRSEEGDDV